MARVLLGCGRVVVRPLPQYLVVLHGPFTPNVSLISKKSSNCIHQLNPSTIHKNIIIYPIICHICINKNIQIIYNPLTDSIRSRRKSIDAIGIPNLSIFLHTQEKPVNNTCLYIDNQIT
jgi:hypothetical protein